MNPVNLPAVARVFDKSMPLMFHLGVLLREKMPLPQALRQMAMTADSRSIKTAAASAAEKLSAGHSASEVFAGRDMKAFPAHCRYILAAPLSEETRGRLLCGWQNDSSRAFSFIQYLGYPIQVFLIGLFMVLSLAMFVLPQFREIFAGSGLKMTGLERWVFDLFFAHDILDMLFAAPLLFIVAMMAVFYIARIIFGTRSSFDELSLFRLLSEVPADQRFKVLEVMAVKHNFPALHAKLKSFARAVNGGQAIVDASRESGLNGTIAWFVQLAAAEEEDNTSILEQGALMLETRVNCAMQRAGSLIEIFAVLSQGLMFGLIVYTVFQAMITIMLGAIA